MSPVHCTIYGCFAIYLVSLHAAADPDTFSRQEMDSIVRKVNELRNTSDDLMYHLTNLQNEKDQLTKVVRQQENIISNMSAELTELKNEKNAIQNDVYGLINDVSTYKQNTKAVRDDLVYMQRERLKLENVVHEHNVSLGKLMYQLQNRKAIGFTVKNSASIKNIATGQTIRFDSVVSLFENCYDDTNGIFTAVESGVYFFFADLRSDWGNVTCWVDLVKNTSAVTTMYLRSARDITSDSTFAILQLNTGDKVWLRNISIGKLCALDNRSFSGYKLN